MIARRILAGLICWLAWLVLGLHLVSTALAEPLTPEASAAIAKAQAFIDSARAGAEPPPSPVDRGGLSALFGASEPAPVVEPFAVEPFDGGSSDHRRQSEPLLLGRGIDADGLFAAVSNCYPSGTMWRPEIDLRARSKIGDRETEATTGYAVADHYISIVAAFPLYSTSDQARERDREYIRRTATAGLVADLAKAVALRGKALREYGLYRALESRASLRVRKGLTDTSEQVGYLAQVADAHASAIGAHSDVERARMGLVAQCRPGVAAKINDYIELLTALEQTQ